MSMLSVATPAAEVRQGRFVCVVGPSGAGKDTLIDYARRELAEDERFYFPRRLITRPPGPGEVHDQISESDFAAGVFAIHWRAHGLGYAVPSSAAHAVADGRITICNLSRAAIEDARRCFAASVVLVTAPPEVLAARIAGRGRESEDELRGRLERESRLAHQPDCELVIQNDEAPEAAGAQLVRYLRSLT